MGASSTSQTAALAFGGYTTTAVGVTEEWNGNAWVELADLNTANNGIAGGGTITAALAFGGAQPSSPTGLTEEWSSTSNTDKTISTD